MSPFIILIYDFMSVFSSYPYFDIYWGNQIVQILYEKNYHKLHTLLWPLYV